MGHYNQAQATKLDNFVRKQDNFVKFIENYLHTISTFVALITIAISALVTFIAMNYISFGLLIDINIAIFIFSLTAVVCLFIFGLAWIPYLIWVYYMMSKLSQNQPNNC